MEENMKEKTNKGITLIALVITIIVLLILAGVSIATLTGENGILTKASKAEEENKQGEAKEQINLAVMSSFDKDGDFNRETFKKEIEKIGGTIVSEDEETIVVELDDYQATVDAKTGEIISFEGEIPDKEAPEDWQVIAKTDREWYNYGNAKIEKPKLKGQMTAIKYIGESQDGNKWANAMTADGSMFVWIPRYAYKITEGYHSNIAGTIEVAFISTANQFLNGETGEITENPNEEGAGITKWLVHPAFTASAANGGGFGEIEGLWIGKFEATGTESSVSVKPGEASLRDMTINTQYQLAKSSTLGESESINSHMAKNSEWGATAYLGHSQYGTNGQKVEKNTNSNYYTGGSDNKETIYTTNRTQSTTHNATGVYDMNGGAWEYVASYVNNGGSDLITYGGITSGDLYGETAEERATSTAYKMVYEGNGTQETDYEIAKKYKGDCVYEISNSYSSWTNAWFQAYSVYPGALYPFFYRSGGYGYDYAGSFLFRKWMGVCWYHLLVSTSACFLTFLFSLNNKQSQCL